ncbi:hypothetical protein AAIH00_35030, partial [Pseudomonas aeruginosa]
FARRHASLTHIGSILILLVRRPPRPKASGGNAGWPQFGTKRGAVAREPDGGTPGRYAVSH